MAKGSDWKPVSVVLVLQAVEAQANGPTSIPSWGSSARASSDHNLCSLLELSSWNLGDLFVRAGDLRGSEIHRPRGLWAVEE